MLPLKGTGSVFRQQKFHVSLIPLWAFSHLQKFLDILPSCNKTHYKPSDTLKSSKSRTEQLSKEKSYI